MFVGVVDIVGGAFNRLGLVGTGQIECAHFSSTDNRSIADITEISIP